MDYNKDFCKKVYKEYISNDAYIGITNVGRYFGLSECQCKKLISKMYEFYDRNELHEIYKTRHGKYRLSKRKNRVVSDAQRKKASISNKLTWSKDTGRRRNKSKKNVIKYCHPKAWTEEVNDKRVKSRKENNKLWHTEETKRKISESQKGKKLTEEHKKKLRFAAIKRLSEHWGQLIPNYNKSICLFFNKINKKYGINILHAESGGEFYIENLGYWVDGYEKNLNMIIEFYEKNHKYKFEKDENRIKQIKASGYNVFIINKNSTFKDIRNLLIYIKEKSNGKF